MRRDFLAPGLFGAWTFRRQRCKIFFSNNSLKIFSKKFFFKKKNFFTKTSFFKKKGFFPKKHFFLQKNVFLPKNFFCLSNKNFFQQQSFTLIKMLMFSKLFISCLSRRIVRIESAGKGMAIGKRRAVIG